MVSRLSFGTAVVYAAARGGHHDLTSTICIVKNGGMTTQEHATRDSSGPGGHHGLQGTREGYKGHGAQGGHGPRGGHGAHGHAGHDGHHGDASGDGDMAAGTVSSISDSSF